MFLLECIHQEPRAQGPRLAPWPGAVQHLFVKTVALCDTSPAMQQTLRSCLLSKPTIHIPFAAIRTVSIPKGNRGSSQQAVSTII